MLPVLERRIMTPTKNTSPPPIQPIQESPTIPFPSQFELSEYSGNATKCLIYFRRVQLERNPNILRKFIMACSYESIRLGTGIKSNVAIKSALDELVDKGWIESIKRGYIQKGKKHRESNTYVFVNPDGVDNIAECEITTQPTNATPLDTMIEKIADPASTVSAIRDLKKKLKASK